MKTKKRSSLQSGFIFARIPVICPQIQVKTKRKKVLAADSQHSNSYRQSKWLNKSKPGLDPFFFFVILIFKSIDFKKTKFKFKFIDCEKTKFKFKFIDFAKVKFKFINNSWADSNSKFKFDPTPTFHAKDSRKILQFAPSKSQSRRRRCVLAHHRCVIYQQLKLLESRIRPCARIAWLGGRNKFWGVREVYLCEVEKGTGAREIYPSLDQMNKVKTKDSKGFFGRNQKFKRFFRPKSGDLKKKKRSLFQQCHVNYENAKICTPLAPSLLISSEHSPRLGGAIFVWGGAQEVIRGSTAPGCPSVAPGLSRTGSSTDAKANEVKRH